MPIWHVPPQPYQAPRNYLLILFERTAAVSTDALLLKGVAKTVTADLILREKTIRYISADALFKKLDIPKTVTTDVLFQAEQPPVTITADLGLKGDRKSVSADVWLKIQYHLTVSVTANLYILSTFVGDTVNFLFELQVSVDAGVTFSKLNIDTALTVNVEFDPPFWDRQLAIDAALALTDIPASFPADTLFKQLNVDASIPIDAFLYEPEPYDPPLEEAQHLPSYTPVVIATFTKTGSPTYTHTWGDHIIGILEHIDPYKHTADIVLHNATKELTDISLVGYTCVIAWGIKVTDVTHTIDSAPTKVVSQTYTSKEGILTVTLKCSGIITMMDEDRASVKESSSTAAERIVEDGSQESYIHDPTDNELGWSIQEWINAICSGSSTAFSHCTAYGTVWHGAGSSFVLGKHFEISVNDRRSDVLRYLLLRSGINMRPERDGLLHFYSATSGTAYTYELLGDHTFFAKDAITSAVLPNYVVVYGSIDEDYPIDPHAPVEHRFQGQAGHGGSIALMGEYRYYEVMDGLESDGACSQMAASIINSLSAGVLQAKATVPMDCFRRIYDYVTFIDVREGSTKAGNVGVIERYFNENGYRANISIGGWTGDSAGNFLNSSSDAGRKVAKIPDTLSASLPDTDLAPGEFIWFANIKAPVQSLLYLHSYNVYAGEGSVKLYVQLAEHSDFLNCYGFPVTSPAGRKYERPIWLTAAGSTYIAAGKYVRFGVINISETETAKYVNASVNYDLRSMKEALY